VFHEGNHRKRGQGHGKAERETLSVWGTNKGGSFKKNTGEKKGGAASDDKEEGGDGAFGKIKPFDDQFAAPMDTKKVGWEKKPEGEGNKSQTGRRTSGT